MKRLLAAAALALAVAQGCSFTTATGFTECTADVDCGAASACSQGYCLPMPTGCRRDDGPGFETGDRVPLAALLPLTDNGSRDLSEEQGLNAIRLAVAEANQGRGIKNRLFGLFVCDLGAPDAGLAVQLEWMVRNAQVPAVLVAGSGATQDAAKNLTRLDAGTFLVSATATSPTLISTFQNEGNVWRIAPTDRLQSKVLGQLLLQDFPDAGGTDLGVLHVDSVYGNGFGPELAEQLRALGFRKVTALPYKDDLTSQTQAVNGLSNEQPQATVIIGLAGSVRALVTLARERPVLQRAMGHRWYLTDGCKDTNALTGNLSELDGVLGTAAAQGAGGAFNSFRDGFRTRFQVDPNSLSYTSHSYDATWVTMLAAAAASRDGAITGPRMAAAMQQLVVTSQVPLPLRADKWVEASDLLAAGTGINVEGASGKLDFDLDAGVPAAPFEVWQVRDGGIGFVRFVEP